MKAARRPARGDTAGVAARRLAWTAVAEVLRRGTALDEVLSGEAAAAPMEPRDAALARAIATVTFRRFGTIRQAVGARLAKGLPKDDRVLALLATGAAQILFLDVPDHAAVDVAVRLARSDNQTAHLSGLVNAVLRRIARERDAIVEADPLHVDTPGWLAERWVRTYGEDQARAIATSHRLGASVDLSVKGDAAGWAERVGGTVLPTGSIRLGDRTAISELPGYAEGGWWVQDAAAAIPARLLVPKPGERIADLCAAPGGKTAELASAGAEVTAVDRSPLRLERLQENLKRLDLTANVVAADVLAFEAEAFDAVLLDAPCTATGTIRRHPDAAWSKREQDVASLADLQSRLLDRAASLVRPGGQLVYCTCSLEPEEGESQAQAFLARHRDFKRVPIDPSEVGGRREMIDRNGDLRTLPSQLGDVSVGKPGLDGFFAVRVSRAR